MKRVFVPTIGDKLTLAKPWKFSLKGEWRNNSFLEALQPGRHFLHNSPPLPIVLPAGTELKVARVYIRAAGQDSRDYDSLTFTCKYEGKRVRFFAHLSDVNTMEVV